MGQGWALLKSFVWLGAGFFLEVHGLPRAGSFRRMFAGVRATSDQHGSAKFRIIL